MAEFEPGRYRARRSKNPTGFDSTGSAAMVGRVVSTPAAIAVGKFLLVNPVNVLGPESEGTAAAVTAPTAATVPVYLVGPGLPQPGDMLVCRFVDFRWVAERGKAPDRSNPCRTTWPRSLSYGGSVGQSEAGFYFVNSSVRQPEPVWTLTYQARPKAIPKTLQVEYYNQPTGVYPPYYLPMPENAWFSPPIPILCFGQPSYCYFYLWMKSCYAQVMVIDAPYGAYGSGTAITEGAGNKVQTYVVPPAGTIPASAQFQMTQGPFPPRRVWGDHGSDDVVPDAQGGAGYPGQMEGS